jgi:hypothetical protein
MDAIAATFRDVEAGMSFQHDNGTTALPSELEASRGS